jgi:hypothetical protein
MYFEDDLEMTQTTLSTSFFNENSWFEIILIRKSLQIITEKNSRLLKNHG